MSQDNKILNRKILARKVIELRTRADISREELSLALGFDNSYISKLEKCKINITIDKLTQIADYFDVELRDLFSNEHTSLRNYGKRQSR